MPLYEYSCTSCGSLNEYIVSPGDINEGLACKKCGGTSLVKKMSVSTIPSHPSPRDGKTCCGRDERCSSPPCGTGCCSK